MSDSTITTTQQARINDFLQAPLLARLATCNPNTLQPHVVPVWYEWDGTSLWINAFSSTRKVREVQKNHKISVVIDTDARGELAKGVLFEGQAEIITQGEAVVRQATSIYTRYLGEDGVLDTEPQSWIHDPESLIIKLTPKRVYTWGLPAE